MGRNCTHIVLVVAQLVVGGCSRSTDTQDVAPQPLASAPSALAKILNEAKLSRATSTEMEGIIGSETFESMLPFPCENLPKIVQELKVGVPTNGDIVAAALLHGLPGFSYKTWVREATELFLIDKMSGRALVHVLSPPMESQPAPSMLIRSALDGRTATALRERIKRSDDESKGELLNLLAYHLDGPGLAADEKTLRQGRTTQVELNKSCSGN